MNRIIISIEKVKLNFELVIDKNLLTHYSRFKYTFDKEIDPNFKQLFFNCRAVNSNKEILPFVITISNIDGYLLMTAKFKEITIGSELSVYLFDECVSRNLPISSLKDCKLFVHAIVKDLHYMSIRYQNKVKYVSLHKFPLEIEVDKLFKSSNSNNLKLDISKYRETDFYLEPLDKNIKLSYKFLF